MRLSPRLRVLLGLITTSLFLMVGATFLAEGNNAFGYLLLALGAYRAYLLVKQIRRLIQTETED